MVDRRLPPNHSDSPLRVAHVVPGLGSGGAERQLYLLCRELTGRPDLAIQNQIFAAEPNGRWRRQIEDLGVSVVDFAAAPSDPRGLWNLRRLINRYRPSVMHCWISSMNLAGAAVAASLGSRRPAVVASVRNVDDWKPAWYRWADRQASRFWDRVICNSHAGAEDMVAAGIAAARIAVIPNGLEPRTFDHGRRARIRASYGLGPGHFVFNSVCRLVDQKRVDRFLSAAAQVVRSVPQSRFVVIGDGPNRPALERMAALSGLSGHVIFAGHLDDPWALVAPGDVFVQCSEREGTSNSLLEAMQAGCVPVVTPVGDSPLVLDGSNAGVVADPGDLAGAMIALTGNRDRLSTASAHAVERAARYEVRHTAEATVRTYRDALEVRSAVASESGAPVVREESCQSL